MTDARPVSEGSRLYETGRAVAEYLEFHYGPEHLGVENFPVACTAAAVAAVEKAAHPGRDRCLDVGCAVGRSSYELARHFSTVDAIDYSHAFIDAARRVADHDGMRYAIPTEGLLTVERTASLGPTELAATAHRVAFQQGDACSLAAGLTGYDLVLAANLIDRLHDPAAFLASMADRIVPGGVLAITSPYTWLEAYTPPEHWLGGRVVEGRSVTTFEGLSAALAPGFALVARSDIPFVIRETARKHQHTIAEFTAWRRNRSSEVANGPPGDRRESP